MLLLLPILTQFTTKKKRWLLLTNWLKVLERAPQCPLFQAAEVQTWLRQAWAEPVRLHTRPGHSPRAARYRCATW